MKNNKLTLLITVCFVLFLATACSNNAVKLGDEVFRSDVGGYTYQVPEGYVHNENAGFTTITPPDADNYVGPGLLIMSGDNPKSMTNEEMLSESMAGDQEAAYTKPVKIKVNGLDGLSVNFTKTSNGVPSNGRIVVVMVNPTHPFLLLGVSTQEKWKTHEAVIAKVLTTVTFFKPGETTP